HMSHLLAVGTPEELKALPEVTPPGTQRLEIQGPDPAGLLKRLRGSPGVREATIFGEAIRALADAGLTANSLGPNGAVVRPAAANLEDVFVSLARRHSV